MDRRNLHAFVRAAGDELAAVRSGLIMMAQTGEDIDLAGLRKVLDRMADDAMEHGLGALSASVAVCVAALDLELHGEPVTTARIYELLDSIAQVEERLLSIPLSSQEFLPDVSGFVDDSFGSLMPSTDSTLKSANSFDSFEIDDDMLDVFRGEAEALLSNIFQSLVVLSANPSDQNALWEIRRNAHTFKGAAGIVEMRDAAEIAHEMEDLLDRLVEAQLEATQPILDFLSACSKTLRDIVMSGSSCDPYEIGRQYSALLGSLRSTAPSSPSAPAPPSYSTSEEPKPSTPVVRVSLDRLDQLMRLAGTLQLNRAALAQRVTQLAATADPGIQARLNELIQSSSRLTDEIQKSLRQIRMVRFGTLETRLARAVNVTSFDEGKKAEVVIENADAEIDTQVVDALIEPLLHLLKNAVVHGIEPPEKRRLIGKPEKGTIRISVEADDEALVMTVSDDGGGISIARLKDKAAEKGTISRDEAEQMEDHEAIRLIFDRGVTTADKIDLNAGRGVGMSIVKEAIESRGGTVLAKTVPHRGSEFTILMPLPTPYTQSADLQQHLNAPEIADLQKPLVLVVDDSVSIRHKIVKFIESEGFRAISAANGADALELLLSGGWDPDLILSDVEMPQLDGWNLLEYVKGDPDFQHIPVVLVTSLNTDAHREKAFEMGAAGYIQKPFQIEDFKDALQLATSSIPA